MTVQEICIRVPILTGSSDCDEADPFDEGWKFLEEGITKLKRMIVKEFSESPITSTEYILLHTSFAHCKDDSQRSANENILKQLDTKNSESKSVNCWVGFKFPPSQQQSTLPKFVQRAMKARFSDTSNAAENVDHSSDSDKEQNLTKYYASAIALSNSPEEMKKRENRVKRLKKDKETKLTLRHTDILFQVRPEEILEKALHMVQTSQKNYLYKCDQLKSIRQDITVQRIRNTLAVKSGNMHTHIFPNMFSSIDVDVAMCQSQLKSLYAEGYQLKQKAMKP
ncbi:hypothetical protein ZIOFF_031483 [Zingiber officinale]|uniref:Uncharacterized protein n=1 Tax=Zingiber officinale TaxID=94328 RepID=A0A8J5L581_ZINOF|nr:hypothetical protein ZIOFF_031483 [Zingiber officinale]